MASKGGRGDGRTARSPASPDDDGLFKGGQSWLCSPSAVVPRSPSQVLGAYSTVSTNGTVCLFETATASVSGAAGSASTTGKGSFIRMGALHIRAVTFPPRAESAARCGGWTLMENSSGASKRPLFCCTKVGGREHRLCDGGTVAEDGGIDA